MKLTVNVTQACITDGEPESTSYCPIAIALMHQGLTQVSVSSRVSFKWNGKYYDVILPPEADKFITDFDNGKAVSPFEFELILNEAKED